MLNTGDQRCWYNWASLDCWSLLPAASPQHDGPNSAHHHPGLLHRSLQTGQGGDVPGESGQGEVLFSISEVEAGLRGPQQNHLWNGEERRDRHWESYQCGSFYCSLSSPRCKNKNDIFGHVRPQLISGDISLASRGGCQLQGTDGSPDPVRVLGSVGEVVQISTSRPHQRLLRRENCHLLRLAGFLHWLAATCVPGRSGRLHHWSGYTRPEHHRSGSL